MISKAGRPAVLATVKELQGTDRKDRKQEGIEFTKLTICPKPESWLDLKAKKYFTTFCDLLISKGLLTDANVGHVLIMAQEFSTYEAATRKLRKKGGMIQTMKTKGGDTYEQPSPWIAIRNQAQKNYRDIASLFGLDPLSSMKVGPGKKSDEDEFEKMHNKYKS